MTVNKKFQYKALDQGSGDIIRGKIPAPNANALEQILRESGLTLISSKEVKSSKLLSSFLETITPKDLITFFVHMEQLEKAGVPLLDSLGDLKDYSTNQKIRDVVQDVYESVKNGKMLSEAMQKHHKVFDKVMISLIAMGEKTGNIELAFKNIYENIKWSVEIKHKTVKAVRYPLFSLTVMILVAAILLKVVVPKVTGFIVEQGIEIPSYTVALMATSKFMENYFGAIILTPIILYIIIKVGGASNNKFARKVDFIKLHMPLLGSIIGKIELSRFTKIFGVTFKSGIPILECLDIAKEVVNNRSIKFEIDRIRQQVSDGSTVSSAMGFSGYFPPLVIRMFKVGEESGNMTNALSNVQYFYDSEINDAIDKIIGSIQPIIIFVMGGLMAWVVAAVFGPIYGNFSNLGV